ncbi:MAG: hypothetical protein ACYCX7_00455 [Solirubrobacteraceae bacterium]
MATEKRTSEQGGTLDVSLVRAYLLSALEHDAVIDPVNELLFDYVANEKGDSAVLASSLGELIYEILKVATFDDWMYATNVLTKEAREALSERDDDLPSPEPAGPRGLASRTRLTRWESKLCSIRKSIGHNAKQTIATAKTDAEAASAVENQASSQSSAQTADDPTTITLDTGQLDRLLSGLGLARLVLDGHDDAFVGYAAADYERLADEILAQVPGDALTRQAARRRLARRS